MARIPIIPGFAPDPSVVRIDDGYFLVTSSFHLFPGLPIYSSADLKTWKHIGGLYAPTTRHHAGKTYIICTNHSAEKPTIHFDNFIIHTDNILSDNWSDPIYFDFYDIDPDLFFADDGRVYVSGCSWKTNPSTRDTFEIDIDTGEKLSPQRVIWDGFTKITPEGPHIYKRNEWYYLLDSEGGTHEHHQLCMARSKSIWGPFESCPQNPILAPTSSNRGHSYIQYNGHGDFFQDKEENWWLLSLAARKDLEGRCVMGRCSECIPTTVSPLVDFVYIRDPRVSDYCFIESGRRIEIAPSHRDLDDRLGPISFVGKRQRPLTGSSVLSEQCVAAGLAYYKDEHRYARIAYNYATATISFEAKNAGQTPVIRTNKKDGVDTRLAQDLGIRFCIGYMESSVNFGYSVDRSEQSAWVFLGTVDTLDLTDRDFTGPCIGVFATRKGRKVSSRGPSVSFLEFSMGGC
ncbi:glycosyl hydrolase [Aspergillus californicus]